MIWDTPIIPKRKVKNSYGFAIKIQTPNNAVLYRDKLYTSLNNIKISISHSSFFYYDVMSEKGVLVMIYSLPTCELNTVLHVFWNGKKWTSVQIPEDISKQYAGKYEEPSHFLEEHWNINMEQ